MSPPSDDDGWSVTDDMEFAEDVLLLLVALLIIFASFPLIVWLVAP